MKWWTYHYNKINLTLDFVPIDANSKKITKNAFLKKLITGNYIPIEVKSKDSSPHYKLFKLKDDTNKAIVSTIKNTSMSIYKHYKMENSAFPNFNVKDLENNAHNNSTLKGKITILKTWFISCKPCVAEFPELNELVDEYKNNKNVQFVSLALDADDKLSDFLKTKPFKYSVVGKQEDLIQNKLKLNAYPTHLIIDSDGNILKVFGKASQMISFLKNYKPI